jgi:hypothetical protein
MALSRMRSSRASGFGTAPARLDHFTLSNNTPGAKYRLPQGVTREGRQRNLGATWSNAPKYATDATKAAANAPGPGSYSRNSSVGRGNVESTLRNEPAIGFGTASRSNSDFAAVSLRRSKDLPGAASYTLPSTLGRQLLSEKQSSRGVRFGHGDRFKKLAVDETFLDGMGYGARRGAVARGAETRARPAPARARATRAPARAHALASRAPAPVAAAARRAPSPTRPRQPPSGKATRRRARARTSSERARPDARDERAACGS